MILTITLTPAEEEQLRARAAQTGQDADAFIANLVRQSLPQHIADDEKHIADDEDEMPAPGESLAEVFAGKTGLFDSKGQFNFSERTGAAFTEILLEKQQRGNK